MKITEEEIKQIILEETKRHLKEIDLATTAKNVGGMSLETFIVFVTTLAEDLHTGPETVLDIYIETALALKNGWNPRRWESFTDEEQQALLKTTYPKTPYDETLDMLIKSFTNIKIRKVIYSDILLAVEKVKDAKKEIKAGEYLGPEEPGGEPKSPYWKEYLEEIVKEEIINHLKENE